MTPKNIIFTAIVLCGMIDLVVFILEGVTFLIFTFVIVVLIILTIVAIASERRFENGLYEEHSD